MMFPLRLVWIQFVAPALVFSALEVAESFVTVYPQVIESRQGTSEKVVLIHEGNTLNLRKASVLAGTVLLRDVTEDAIVERRVEGAYYERNLFEDTIKQASLLLEPQGHAGYAIRGLVNSTHQIEPVESLERSSSSGKAHRLLRIRKAAEACGTEDVTANLLQQNPEPRKADTKAPSANYELELYFISDYNHTIYFKNRTEDRVEYAMLFLNSVSLRLAQLDPPISLLVTAIQGSFTDKEPYLEHYEGGRLNASATLQKLVKYFDNNTCMKNTDAVLMAAGRHMVNSFKGGKAASLQGLAFVGQTCRPNKVSIAQDQPGKFNGINSAAHEIGHLLGAHHDGDRNGANCSSADGYMMSKYGGGKRGFTFSECSKKSIADFITWPYSLCLRKRSTCGVISVPKKAVKLPGDVMDGATYCKKYNPKYQSSTYIKVESDLKQCRFRCLVVPVNGKKARNVTGFALDGTPCSTSDPKKVCKNSICE